MRGALHCNLGAGRDRWEDRGGPRWCYACEVFKRVEVIGIGAVGESTARKECG
jgi:hypothetical protein